MYRRIVVPLGGSKLAEWAVPWALSVARGGEAEVEFVFVWTPLRTLPDNLMEGTGEGWAEAYLEGFLDRLDKTDVKTSVKILRGTPSERLEDHIRITEPDLVVMATHGRGPLTRMWLGSVADHLLRNTIAPLLLVRPREGDLDLARRPGVKRILVPLDGSEEAESALEEARVMGRPWNATYTLLRVVWVPLEMTPAWVPDGLADRDVAVGTMEREAAAALTKLQKKLEADGDEAEIQVLEGVHPAQGILTMARETDADLIAMATHGRGGMSRVLLGSVADKVVRGTHLPVLLKRPWEES